MGGIFLEFIRVSITGLEVIVKYMYQGNRNYVYPLLHFALAKYPEYHINQRESVVEGGVRAAVLTSRS